MTLGGKFFKGLLGGYAQSFLRNKHAFAEKSNKGNVFSCISWEQKHWWREINNFGDSRLNLKKG